MCTDLTTEIEEQTIVSREKTAKCDYIFINLLRPCLG